MRTPIKHCKNCGTAVENRVPDDGDTRVRAVCPSCATIHYENPLNVVGTIPVWKDQVLLCKRNIEPRFGKWTLPAGFLELGETLAHGAGRETQEEAGAQFVGRNILEQILAQPDCIGINVYKALNEQGEKTYVLVGMDKQANPILDITAVNANGQLDHKEGIVADRNIGVGWFDKIIK